MSQFQPPTQPQWQEPHYPPLPETYYPPTQTPLSPMPPPRKRLRRNDKIALGVIGSLFVVIVLIVAIGVIAASPIPQSPPLSAADQQATSLAQSDATTVANLATVNAVSNNAPQPTDTPTPVAQPTTVPASPVPTFVTFGDGSYQVGTDIKAGTYRTQTASQGCYYERLKGFSGTLTDILANNNTDDPAIVTILPTDKGFTSQNCGTWTTDLSQITTSNTTFTDGMYIIGTDIKPGTYKSSGSQGCYYARLSGFTGSLYSILANNNTDNAAIVTIYASDKGFESTRCGTWTRI